MKVNVEKQPKSTLKINITVPHDKVKEIYDLVVNQIVANAELDGFRKGKAPKNVVLEKTDPNKINSEVVNRILKIYYTQALKEQHIAPVSNPMVDIKELNFDKDFEFSATVAVRPEIKVSDDYRKKLKKYYENKNKEIKKLNEEKLKKGEPLDHDHAHLTTEDIANVLIEESELEVSDLVVQEEVDRMMSRLINQAQTVGMQLEQYLLSQNKTKEELRQDYAKIAEKNVKLEFILNELIKKENIQVTEEEIQQSIDAVGDENLKKQMQTPTQKLYIKTVLEKNKLISNIAEEIEGENHHE